MDKIYLQVCAGLANRLRATVSGLCAAEDLSKNIIISWPAEHVFGATWEDIFEPEPWATAMPMGYFRMCLSPADWEKEKRKEPIVIKSYGQFYPTSARWLAHLRSFKPKGNYLNRVKELFGTVKPVGVHIRRTDNLRSILNSPTTSFFDVMDAMPDRVFFIATDDPKEYEAMFTRYPGRIIQRTPLLRRDTLKGIQDAFLDFLALSRCTEIIGSSGSSFSEIAALYGNIPLKIIQ
jgi:hypothetical protein